MLARILTGEHYPDFAALWLLLHETRFGRDGQPVNECVLETWRDAGREEGTRAREHLRNGVEEALVSLGLGFLSPLRPEQLHQELPCSTLFYLVLPCFTLFYLVLPCFTLIYFDLL